MQIAPFLKAGFLIPQTFVVAALVVADAVVAVVAVDAVAAVAAVDVVVGAAEAAAHYYFAVAPVHFAQEKIPHRDLLGNHQVQLEQVSIAPKR